MSNSQTTAELSYTAASIRSMYGPLQVINPHAAAWHKGRIVVEQSEIAGRFDCREQWVLVTSPRTGEQELFHFDRRILDASGEDEVARVWKCLKNKSVELHVLND